MSAPIALAGLPEADGVTPFLLATPLGEGETFAVVAGTVHASGVDGVDGGEMSAERIESVLGALREQGDLREVPVHGLVHHLLHAADVPQVALVLGALPAGVRNAAQVVDPLRELAEDAVAAEPDMSVLLQEGRQAVVFGLPAHQLRPAVDASRQALMAAGGAAGKRAALAGVIDVTADALLDNDASRTRWAFAMDFLSWRASCLNETERMRAARGVSAQLRAGARGRDIPFVRVWVERQLAGVTEMLMNRQQT